MGRGVFVRAWCVRVCCPFYCKLHIVVVTTPKLQAGLNDINHGRGDNVVPKGY